MSEAGIGDHNSFVEIIRIAASLGTWLSVIGVVMTLSFGVFYLVVARLNLRKIVASETAFILKTLLRYVLYLSIAVLLIGSSIYVASWFFAPNDLRDRIRSSLQDRNYAQVIMWSAEESKKSRGDPEILFFLGTALYATKQFKQGIELFSKMNKDWSRVDICDYPRMGALTSLVAFYSENNEVQQGLKISNLVIKCPTAGDPIFFNHAGLLAGEGKVDSLARSIGYQFKSRYYKSRFALLQYTYELKRHPEARDAPFDKIKEAYCLDDRIKYIILGQFSSSDPAFSPQLADQYSFSISVINHAFNAMERSKLVFDLTNNAPCVGEVEGEKQ